MSRHAHLLFVSLLACGTDPKGGSSVPTEGPYFVGDHEVRLYADGSLDLVPPSGSPLEGLRLIAGSGSATVEMQVGSYLFSDIEEELDSATSLRVLSSDGQTLELEAAGSTGNLGTLHLGLDPSGALTLRLAATGASRLGFSADCTEADHFLGAGLHAMDVDHVGERFALWVSEPGLGKVDSDEPPDDWYLRGTRHSSSFPMPYVLRPHSGQGLLLDASGRVDLDLCATDPGRFSMVGWDEDQIDLQVFSADNPRQILSQLAAWRGRPPLPPEWVFSPWNDALRGSAEVRAMADRLRNVGAASSAIWSEDWRGAHDSETFGYHPGPDWDLGREIYPDAEEVVADLDAQGFRWLAYFAPFLTPGTEAFSEAQRLGALPRTPDGAEYLFPGPFFNPVSVVDLTGPGGQELLATYLEDCLNVGFGGWMADFAEWMPYDAVLADGSTGATAHNLTPELWQAAHLEAIEGTDASFFVRSGWTRTPALAPVVWAGDQRTDMQTDDGLPSVIPMGLSAGVIGVGVFTHDVGGYQSATNPVRDAETWYRWATLGAFSPVMRTHHGNQSLDNFQVDSTEQSLADWARFTHWHNALFPYRYGLAATGEPMVLPPLFFFPEDDPARTDAWMLGPSLFVAPIVSPGTTEREVNLPPGVRWFDWWTGAAASSGTYSAELDHILVFVPEGSVIPTLENPPLSTYVPGATEPAAHADTRRIRVFGGAGEFTEADGTRYQVSGTVDTAGETSGTGDNLALSLGGATIQIAGPVSRTYIVEIWP